MRLPISLWCYTFCAFIVSISSAVATESQQDIETITVTARATQNRALQMTSTLDSEKLELLTPATFADVLRNIPGVGVRTNSRGETILRIRGSDERQTQVFLDGAPFTIPWDSRLDLNMLPASLIRHVSVIKARHLLSTVRTQCSESSIFRLMYLLVRGKFARGWNSVARISD